MKGQKLADLATTGKPESKDGRKVKKGCQHEKQLHRSFPLVKFPPQSCPSSLNSTTFEEEVLKAMSTEQALHIYATPQTFHNYTIDPILVGVYSVSVHALTYVFLCQDHTIHAVSYLTRKKQK